MRIPEVLLTFAGVGLTGVLLGGVVWVTHGLRTGIWGTIAILAIIVLFLVARAAYQLVCEVEVRRDWEAQADRLAQVLDGLQALWRDGDQIKWRITNDYAADMPQAVEVYTIQMTELLEQACPRLVVAFLNDGFPDGGINTPEQWEPERRQAYRDITVRLHRLKEDVIDRLEAERLATLARA